MSETFHLFNLATMSGVFPGTRTMRYQRVRLQALDRADVRRWARLLWYDDPPACVAELEPRNEDGDSPATARPLLRIPNPHRDEFALVLSRAMAAAGWQLEACGTCAHWRPLAAGTPGQAPLGGCRWQMEDSAYPPVLGVQSLLALPCLHWRIASEPVTGVEASREVQAPSAVEVVPIAPMRKRAEQESDERWTLVGQVRRWFGRKQQPAAAPVAQAWADRVVERSGVGAGTEPCFACQGRIANLGALAVATPEGDKQTFSVWRCRQCYSYYLNDWIDRWERMDNLETEERYFRLSPAEALEVLAVIENVVHAEHPARRHERDAQRQWVLDFVAGHAVLSHQIRQGR